MTPPALSSVSSASGVTSPNSSTPSLPGDASSVTPPGSSVPPSSSTPTSSGVTPPSSSSPNASPVTPPSSGGTVTAQALTPGQIAGVQKILRECYGEAMSLGSNAQLSEKEAQVMMGKMEKCSQEQFTEQLTQAYTNDGMSAADAKQKSADDLTAVLDYQNATSMTPAQRVEMNMNNAIGLYTGSISVKEWKAAREKIRGVNLKFQDCEKNNSDKKCKQIFNINGGLGSNKGLTTGFNALTWSQNQLGAAQPIVQGAQNAAFKHIEKAKCNKTYANQSGGAILSAGGEITAGLAYGFGVQGSLGVGVIVDGPKVYIVGDAEGGAAIGGPGKYASAITSPSGTPPTFFGAYAGVGVGLSVTNASTFGIQGAFDKINFNAGYGFSVGGSLSFASNGSNGYNIAGGFTPDGRVGAGFGVSASYYPTNTVLIKFLIWDRCA